jgi:hypothetical protein
MVENPSDGDEPVVPDSAGSEPAEIPKDLSSEVPEEEPEVSVSNPAPSAESRDPPLVSGDHPPVDLDRLDQDRPPVDLDELGEKANLGPGKRPSLGLPTHSDKIRGRIAAALIGLVTLVILASFVTLWAGSVFKSLKYENLKDLLTIIFGPLIALASAAIGYYFGGKDKA